MKNLAIEITNKEALTLLSSPNTPPTIVKKVVTALRNVRPDNIGKTASAIANVKTPRKKPVKEHAEATTQANA